MTERLPEYDRNSEAYIAATIQMKPKDHDRPDLRMRRVVANTLCSEPWTTQLLMGTMSVQLSYLKELIKNRGDIEHAHHVSQGALAKISDLLKSRIEEGAEHLAPLSGQPVLLTTNHLGLYKLNHIDPQTRLGPDVPKYEGYDFMYPFLLYFGAFYPVAKALDDNLSYASLDYPGIFGQIHSDAGFIHIPPASQVPGGQRTSLLTEQTRQLFSKRPNTVLTIFPEGGTGGKYREAGPYDLRTFRTGAYVVAASLGVPILPVAQHFNPRQEDGGMCLKVFEPYYPEAGADKEYYGQQAAHDHALIQMWLDQKEQDKI